MKPSQPTRKLGEFIRRNSRRILILGITLSFVGSIFLIIGALPSKNQILQVSGTYFDYNPYLKANLEQNKNLAEIGFIFLAAGFLLQLVSTLSSDKKD